MLCVGVYIHLINFLKMFAIHYGHLAKQYFNILQLRACCRGLLCLSHQITKNMKKLKARYDFYFRICFPQGD